MRLLGRCAHKTAVGECPSCAYLVGTTVDPCQLVIPFGSDFAFLDALVQRLGFALDPSRNFDADVVCGFCCASLKFQLKDLTTDVAGSLKQHHDVVMVASVTYLYMCL